MSVRKSFLEGQLVEQSAALRNLMLSEESFQDIQAIEVEDFPN